MKYTRVRILLILVFIPLLFVACRKDQRPTLAIYHYEDEASSDDIPDESSESTNPSLQLEGKKVIDAKEISTPSELSKILLSEGNIRFINGTSIQGNLSNTNLQQQLEVNLPPMAMFIVQSSTTLPLDTIFDQRPGSILTLQNFSNTLEPPFINSVSKALEKNDIPLLTVIEVIQNETEKATVLQRVLLSVDQLSKEAFLKSKISSKKLSIHGAIYNVSSGQVEFLNKKG